VIELNLDSIFQFYRRKEVWVLYFYDSKKKECKDYAYEYQTLAQKMNGILKVGAINCAKEEALCEEFDFHNGALKSNPSVKIPQIFSYSDNVEIEGEMLYKTEGHPVDWQKVGNFAARKLQNFVTNINIDTIDTFFQMGPKRYHILVIHDKTTTPALFKALSK
jgi:hypothetical protein